MLQKLSVRNYALIRELDIEFENGLTIITGETGAGKSILLGALSLILGTRVDTAVLLDKNEKCVVEGTFRIEEYDLKGFFDTNGIDHESTSIIRREINPAGKSRAFINDTPVTINLLKELGDKLIDIHSQHQTLMLNDNSFQLNLIDSFSGTSDRKADYRRLYNGYLKLRKEFNDAREKADKNRSDLEYYQFQLKQLDEANLKNNEQEELESEQEMLEHAEEIKLALCQSAEMFLKEGDSVLSMLRTIKANLAKIRFFLPEGESLFTRSETSLIELDDLASEIDRLSARVESDPGRLSYIVNRLDTIYSLMQKHKLNDINELIIKREELREQVKSISTADDRLSELEKILNKELASLQAVANQISEKRAAVVPEIEKKVTEILKQLGMPNAKFRINLNRLAEFTQSGIDQADFLFSSNRQVQPENLARIASGGELSRVMLSLKSLLTKYNNLPTIIFDEIDSGVSGEVADKVGQILSGMGKYMQVVNITHLPQVASRGTKHYHVYKDDEHDSTFTRVKLLTPDERIMEVAKLLSGSEVTEAAIRNAKELLEAGIN